MGVWLKSRFVACMFWCICHQHLCLIEQFGHFIACYDNFLVCLQIYAVKLWMWDQSIIDWSISHAFSWLHEVADWSLCLCEWALDNYKTIALFRFWKTASFRRVENHTFSWSWKYAIHVIWFKAKLEKIEALLGLIAKRFTTTGYYINNLDNNRN